MAGDAWCSRSPEDAGGLPASSISSVAVTTPIVASLRCRGLWFVVANAGARGWMLAIGAWLVRQAAVK